MQVRHPVQDDLESRPAQCAHGLLHFLDGVAALVDLEDVVIQALQAQLHLGHAQAAQMGHLARADSIRPGLDHHAHIAKV